MKEKPIDQFEAIARRLVEGSFNRLFSGRLDVTEISAELLRVAESNRRGGVFPNDYQVELSPTDYTFWRENQPTLEQDLAQLIVELSQRTGATLIGWPHVELAANTGLGRNQIAVRAAHNAELREETGVLIRSADSRQQIEAVLLELDAFLIVDGKHHVPLRQPVIAIGRRANNDVVVDAATVSRRHAQIRWRFGRFIVTDLGSRGGTYVNGRRVDECVLQPGDVITLSDKSLIYGEGLDETRRIHPHSSTLSESTQLFAPISVSDQSD